MMRDELDEFEKAAQAPAVQTDPAPLQSERSGRIHWVVVTTRPASQTDKVLPAGMVLLTRFWHPRDHCWSENAFESLDHAIRLFVDESGWVLRQQQSLDGPQAYELIFEARREDFSRPSTEQMLQDVGLTPQDVARLLKKGEDEGTS
jgi:hypothetical protein